MPYLREAKNICVFYTTEMLQLAFSRLSLTNASNSASKTARFMAAGVTIPSNLHLEDLEVVLEDEVATTPSIRNVDYKFPPLKVNETLEVMKFQDPGVKTGEMCPFIRRCSGWR